MSTGSFDNPNFPKDLAIYPSNPHSSPFLAKDPSDHAIFGFLAQESAIRKYGIAGRVWEAAYAMTRYVHPPPNLIFDPPFIDASGATQSVSVIELGSGTGLVASCIASYLKPGRDRLIVTDLPEVCSLLEHNLQSIKMDFKSESLDQNPLVIRQLSWGNHDDARALASEFFDPPNARVNAEHNLLTHVICSDLVYFPELLAPLLRSLLHLSSPPFIIHETEFTSTVCGPSILISYKIRSLAKETPFWSAFGLWFDFSPVLVKDNLLIDSEWQRFGENFDDTTFLFIAQRRTESLKWTIPTNDLDLLQGVGANGTDHRKGDDTFENLLLMSLEQD